MADNLSYAHAEYVCFCLGVQSVGAWKAWSNYIKHGKLWSRSHLWLCFYLRSSSDSIVVKPSFIFSHRILFNKAIFFFVGKREALELDIHLSVLGIPCYVQRVGQPHMAPTRSHMPLGQFSVETFFSRKALLAIVECCINKDLFWWSQSSVFLVHTGTRVLNWEYEFMFCHACMSV